MTESGIKRCQWDREVTTTSFSDSATPQRCDAETQTMTDAKKLKAVDEVLDYLEPLDNSRDRIKEDVEHYIAGIASLVIYYPFSAVYSNLEFYYWILYA